MKAAWPRGGSARGEGGLVLTLVLVVFLVVEVIVAGALAVVMSDLGASVSGQQALHAVNVAEAGLHYGVGQLVAEAAREAPSDIAYAGEPEDVVLPGADGRPLGTFSLSVTCVYPPDQTPPGCEDDSGTPGVDERDLRHIRSTGFVPARPGRARRQIEATIRRYMPPSGDQAVFGICGRERVEVGPDTSIIADVGSNGDVVVDGPSHPRAVGGRIPRAPSWAPLVEAVEPTGTPGLSGAYSWRITFYDQRGEESGGSPPTPSLILADQQGRLTHVPVGGQTIVRRRIYRSAVDAPGGPWFLVGEIPDNESREYTDSQPDSTLRWRIPGVIAGRIIAAGAVSCSESCPAQVDGQVASGVREVLCPNFLATPADPGSEPVPESIIQTTPVETVHWGALHIRADKGISIETLSVPGAELHIHVSEIYLERGARLAITGAATVYFHVSGAFILDEGAVFGAIDFSGNLLKPADRVHVLMDRRDPALSETGLASVRWQGENRVAAMIFAPGANILIDRARAFRGGLYGRYVRISRSGGVFLDPIEGMGSERSLIRPSPFQYLLRWYDNPGPGVER